MAVNINDIKYIPDLPAAKPLTDGDLLHLNQTGVDAQLTLRALEIWMNDKLHPVGSLLFFGIKTIDPNTLFPGQVWVRTAQGAAIRGCDDNEADLGTIIGSDGVTIQTSQMPSHSHTFGLSTDAGGLHKHSLSITNGGSHRHGATSDAQNEHAHSAGASASGDHYHEYIGDDELKNAGAPPLRPAGNWDADSSNQGYTAWVYRTNNGGTHYHTITVYPTPAHSHNITVWDDGLHSHGTVMGDSPMHTHTINGSINPTGGGNQLSVINRSLNVAIWRRTA